MKFKHDEFSNQHKPQTHQLFVVLLCHAAAKLAHPVPSLQLHLHCPESWVSTSPKRSKRFAGRMPMQHIVRASAPTNTPWQTSAPAVVHPAPGPAVLAASTWGRAWRRSSCPEIPAPDVFRDMWNCTSNAIDFNSLYRNCMKTSSELCKCIVL